MNALIFVPSFIDSLPQLNDNSHFKYNEFNSKPSKRPPSVFALELADGLELDEDIIILGLFLVKKAIEKKIYILRKCLYRYSFRHIDLSQSV